MHFRPVDLTGKVAVLTGGTAGIGLVNAKVLAPWNATVVLPARNMAKAEARKAEIEAELPAGSTGRVDIRHCDLASLASVRKFATELANGEDETTYDSIDILILNAGITGCQTCDISLTEDSYESVFQANYLGHCLLTRLLLPAVRRAPAGRIVHVSSRLHYTGSLSREAIEAGKADLATARINRIAYSDAELMQVVFSNTIQRREFEQHPASRVSSVAVHPGFVCSDLDREGGLLGRFVKFIRKHFARPTADGAVTQVTAATLPSPAWLDSKRVASPECTLKTTVS